MTNWFIDLIGLELHLDATLKVLEWGWWSRLWFWWWTYICCSYYTTVLKIQQSVHSEHYKWFQNNVFWHDLRWRRWMLTNIKVWNRKTPKLKLQKYKDEMLWLHLRCHPAGVESELWNLISSQKLRQNFQNHLKILHFWKCQNARKPICFLSDECWGAT